MASRTVIFISLVLFSFPFVISAEEPGLVEAMCQQVLEPREETSVLGVVKNHFAKKFSALPGAVFDDVKGVADSGAETLAEKVESQEFDSEVLGASVINPAVNESLDGFGFLLRHWVWSLAGLGAAVLYFLFR